MVKRLEPEELMGFVCVLFEELLIWLVNWLDLSMVA